MNHSQEITTPEHSICLNCHSNDYSNSLFKPEEKMKRTAVEGASFIGRKLLSLGVTGDVSGAMETIISKKSLMLSLKLV